MKYSEYIQKGNKVSYLGVPVKIDEILDISHEYVPDVEELDENPSLCHARVIFEDWRTDTVVITELSPLRRMADLTYNECEKLWRQFKNSGDYSNTLGVDSEEIAYCYDGFLDTIGDTELSDFTEDNAENFALYCSWFD